MASGVSPLVEAVFNHLVLPARLPGGVEALPEGLLDSTIASWLSTTARQSRKKLQSDYAFEYDLLTRCLDASRNVMTPIGLSKHGLLQSFSTFESAPFLFLHLNAPSAGLLIWKRDEETVVFEAFEASPPPEKVLETKSALKIDFPSLSVAIAWTDFQNPSFQANLASYLEQAAAEQIPQFCAKVTKTGADVVEVRETPDSAVVTGLLMTILEAFGERVHCSLISKRVHDDVVFEDSRTPWRRCPLWLVYRVGLRRFFHIVFGDENGRAHYKFLTAAFLMYLLESVTGKMHPAKVGDLRAKICRVS